MTSPIISVHGLSKSYRLYTKPSDRLREALFPWINRHSTFFALQDVSFSIQAGEQIGILGVNGAGKSTLLQILAGVLTPTSGTVEVGGSLACLLELGAGFNPELTGRENVTLQFQLYALPWKEIQERIVEVEAFAEVGDFFDQPVKIYSSGMFLRVAFASAILVNPDILIIDEALSVGDARFQKKCHDRLNHMRKSGTTVILVTHDIFGAKANCSRLLLLDKGHLVTEGNPEDVVTRYMQILYPSLEERENLLTSLEAQKGTLARPTSKKNKDHNEYIFHVEPNDATNQWGHGGAKLLSMRFIGLLPPNRFVNGQKIIVECDYSFEPPVLQKLVVSEGVKPKLALGMRLDTGNGIVLCDFSSAAMDAAEFEFDIFSEKYATFRFEAILPNLAPGDYFFSPEISIGDISSYTAIAVYENVAVLQCERISLVLGLFKPDYLVERIINS